MYLTLEETKKHFRVKDNRTIIKFTQQGLKFIKIGAQYRFDLKDIEEFEEKLKNEEQEKMIQIYPIKRKRKSKKIDVDFEKIRINRELNRVV
ncbi:MAG: helix-turn-helix domain-containing protein [Clostridia bacterium]